MASWETFDPWRTTNGVFNDKYDFCNLFQVLLEEAAAAAVVPDTIDSDMTTESPMVTSESPTTITSDSTVIASESSPKAEEDGGGG